ncbi:hypothetical protein GIY62_24625 [Burkholderia plantarii]|uniref:hypothetical protein n=1 Tax=Burkholderia plantarii TaxID=41899 RepID=UPI00272D3926|nr:hypothetical protein [Burkholderia plantarii]WLE63473.1 hypothetical protein GIY62_24625 [Burkholderia plantarii]
MTLHIAASQIQQPSRLSASARSCLSLIDGGVQWLQWAIQSPGQHFRLPDETQMLCAVQQGLHGDPLCLLPVSELLVSPAKLMTMDGNDLQTLTSVEAQGKAGPDPVLENQLASLLVRHKLVRRADLAALPTWLGQLGIDTSPVFQCLSLDDAGALVELMRTVPSSTSADANEAPSTPAGTQASAAFAAAEARTPMEFVDYLRFHQVLSARNLAAQAQTLLHATLPELFGSLEGPQLRGLPTPDTVVQVVRDWYAQSRQLGFSRLSLGALRMIQRTGYPGGSEPDVRTALWRYTTAAQILLSSVTSVSARMGQDGRTCSYELRRGTQGAVLCLDKHGVISLDDFIADTSPGAASGGSSGTSGTSGATPAPGGKSADKSGGTQSQTTPSSSASLDDFALGYAA